MFTRRFFLKQSFLTAGSLVTKPLLFAAPNDGNLKISLAEWSFHRALKSGKLDHLDFPAKAKKDFGIDAVEYVSGFFGGKRMTAKEAAKNQSYLTELLNRSKDAGVFNHLIMVDDEGPLAMPRDEERLLAVDNHKKMD